MVTARWPPWQASRTAFRRVAREFGAAYTVTEMISAKGLMYGDRKTAELMRLAPDEHPVAVQIFGSDVEAVRIAVPLAVDGSGADVLDINMGCPTPKIVNNGDGSALMRDLARAEAVIRTAVSASRLPVTVKFRLGWDEGSRNCVEFARMAQAAGAAAVCVHGRTRAQQYAGRADWDMLARVREAVDIPLSQTATLRRARRRGAAAENRRGYGDGRARRARESMAFPGDRGGNGRTRTAARAGPCAASVRRRASDRICGG